MDTGPGHVFNNGTSKQRDHSHRATFTSHSSLGRTGVRRPRPAAVGRRWVSPHQRVIAGRRSSCSDGGRQAYGVVSASLSDPLDDRACADTEQVCHFPRSEQAAGVGEFIGHGDLERSVLVRCPALRRSASSWSPRVGGFRR
jgi:hypothetical protein